jgi:dCTP diphosphatase
MTSEQSVSELRRQVAMFAREREWEQFHDPKSLALALASEAGELCAALRWIPAGEADSYAAKEPLRSQLLEEVGDVAIVLLLFCERVQIDLAAAVLAKLVKNATKYPSDQSRGRPHPPAHEPTR